MKKWGKFEKGAPKAKDLLLQTYFTSLVSLILCVGLFLGTTYSWFTSQVEVGQNTIHIGILKVDMTVKDAEGTTITNGPVYADTIRWEPGYTALRTVTVKNQGDLAFNYNLDFIPELKEEQTLDKKVAEQFEVWVYTHTEDTTYTKPTDFSQINEDNGWRNAGNLDKILEDGLVCSGSVGPELTAEKTEHTYTIALHMKETAANEVTGGGDSLMGKELRLTVRLVAYQSSVEKDSFDAYYDNVVSSPRELKEAIAEGGRIVLASDIDVGTTKVFAQVTAEKPVTIQLNNHKITATLESPDAATALFQVQKGGSLTIEGQGEIQVVANKSKDKISAIISNEAGSVIIRGGKFTMAYGSDSEGYLIPTIIDNNSTHGAATVTIEGGTFTHTRNMFRNYSNHAAEAAKLIINGGIFNGDAADAGCIWNQKPSATTPAGAGLVEINGGTFNYMEVCTGFADAENNPTGVTVKNVTLGKWTLDGAEWIAPLSN